MEKINLKQAAEKLFAATAHQVLWANTRGEFFTSENIGTLSLKKDEKLTKFERDAETSLEKEHEFNAKESIAKIKTATSLEDLKAFEADERKSVKEAYDKKVVELTAAITVVGAATETGANGNEDTEGKK